MKTLKLAAVVSVVLTVATSTRATTWNVIKQAGRDYVTFGNVAEFYHFNGYSHANRAIALQSDRRSVRAQAGTSELFINNVRFFTHFPIISEGDESLISAMDVGKIIEPVLRPSRIADASKVETVVLDPGHGGMDGGTISQWGDEKSFALDVALGARDQLQRAGYKVEMTRTTDAAVSLEDRVAFANRFPHAIFVSIHFNSGGGDGVESYLLAPDGVISNASSEHHLSVDASQPNEGNAQDGQNVALAAAVHASVLARVSAFDRGVRHARFKVLRDIRIPAILVEAGFLTDPREGQRIATAQYRQQLGAAIAQGVQTYDVAVNYRPPDSTLTVAKTSVPPQADTIAEPLSAEAPPSPAPVEPPVSLSGSK